MRQCTRGLHVAGNLAETTTPRMPSELAPGEELLRGLATGLVSPGETLLEAVYGFVLLEGRTAS